MPPAIKPPPWLGARARRLGQWDRRCPDQPLTLPSWALGVALAWTGTCQLGAGDGTAGGRGGVTPTPPHGLFPQPNPGSSRSYGEMVEGGRRGGNGKGTGEEDTQELSERRRGETHVMKKLLMSGSPGTSGPSARPELTLRELQLTESRTEGCTRPC